MLPLLLKGRVNAQNNRGDEEVKKNDQNMCRRGGSHDDTAAVWETLTLTPDWRNEPFCKSSAAKNKPAARLQRVSQH